MSETTTVLFPASVYQRRREQLATAARAAGLGGLIIGTGPELAYLSGSWITSFERFTALVIPAASGAAPTFILPEVDRGELQRCALPETGVAVIGWVDGDNPYAYARAALGELKGDTAIGLGSSLTADHVLALQALIPGPTVLASTVLREQIMRKEPEEIALLRDAGAAIDRVHAAVPTLLQPGRSERDVAKQLEALILQEGHSAVDFVIVGSAENGANPHHDYSDRILSTGDMVVVDIGGTFGPGYHSDCTRTYVVGGAAQAAKLDPRLAQMYETLQRAQVAAVAAVRPGIPAEKIDAAARKIITDAGFGEQFIHRTGHGIGLSTHEEPFIMAGNNLILEPGMVFSVEPGIYFDDVAGARIEDIVVVTDTGCETLNNQPRTLQ